MHEALVRWLGQLAGWIALPEVSFSIGGERGVIDVVAWHAASRSLLVIELKTRIVDVSALMATMDIRRRVARRIAREHGWEPTTASIWVVVAPSRTNARVLAEYRVVLRAKFPADGRSMRRWLAHPDGAVAGLSFLPAGRQAQGPGRWPCPGSVPGPRATCWHGIEADRPGASHRRCETDRAIAMQRRRRIHGWLRG
jgi:hypothetical protein